MDAKPGTIGKVYIFPYNNCWENKYFEEKIEVIDASEFIGEKVEFELPKNFTVTKR